MHKVFPVFVQRLALAAMLLLAPLLAQAQTQSPEEMIRDNIESFMSQINGKEDYYANNLDELKALVNESLKSSRFSLYRCQCDGQLFP